MKKLLLFIAIAFIGMKGLAQAPNNNLLAYYGFEGNALSHNLMHDLTKLNTTAANVSYTTGVYPGTFCADFNATGLKNTTIAPLITSEFTVAYWAKSGTPSSLQSDFEMFAAAYVRKAASTNLYDWGLSVTNGVYQPGSITTNQSAWRHIAMTFKTVGSNKIVSIYLNGNLQGTSTIPGTNNIFKYDQVFCVGGGTNGAGAVSTVKLFNGQIDEFYVYNRALTAAEISLVANDTDGPIQVVSSDAYYEGTTAQITSKFQPFNQSTSVVINYGIASNNLNMSAAHGSVSGNSEQTLVTNLMGLSGATFYYQLVMTNALGTKSSPVYTVTPSLVSAFRFNNSFANTTNTVTLQKAETVYTLPSFTTDRNGNTSSAVFLKNLETLKATISNLPLGNTKRSVSLWMKRDNTMANDNNVFVWGTAVNNQAYGLTYQASNLLRNYGYANDAETITTLANDTAWRHIVLTYGYDTVKIYVNGTLVRALSIFGWNTIGNELRLGEQVGAGNNTRIHLDDFEIYNTVLSDAQVATLNSSGVVLSNQNFNANNLKATIYPNPASNNFTIEMENEVKSVEVFSLQGQKVLTSKNKNVDVSSLSKGMYLVRIEDENNAVATQKLIIK